jgi:hypothetical protein
LSSIDRAIDERLLLTGQCVSAKLFKNFDSTVLSTLSILFFGFFLPPTFIEAGITSVVAMTVSESGGSILARRANFVAQNGNSALAPTFTLEEAPSESYGESANTFIPTDDSEL